MSFSRGFKVGWDAVDEGLEDFRGRRAADQIAGLDTSGLSPMQVAAAKADIYERNRMLDAAEQMRLNASTLATQAQARDQSAETHPVTLENLRRTGLGQDLENLYDARSMGTRLEGLAADNASKWATADYQQAMTGRVNTMTPAMLANMQAETGRTREATRGLAIDNDAAAQQRAQQEALDAAWVRIGELPEYERTPENLLRILSPVLGAKAAQAAINEYGAEGVLALGQRRQMLQESLYLAEQEDTLEAYAKWWDTVKTNTGVSIKQNPQSGRWQVHEIAPDGSVIETVADGPTKADALRQVKRRVQQLPMWQLAATDYAARQAEAKREAEMAAAEMEKRRQEAEKARQEGLWYSRRPAVEAGKAATGVMRDALLNGNPDLATLGAYGQAAREQFNLGAPAGGNSPPNPQVIATLRALKNSPDPAHQAELAKILANRPELRQYVTP